MYLLSIIIINLHHYWQIDNSSVLIEVFNKNQVIWGPCPSMIFIRFLLWVSACQWNKALYLKLWFLLGTAGCRAGSAAINVTHGGVFKFSRSYWTRRDILILPARDGYFLSLKKNIVYFHTSQKYSNNFDNLEEMI